MVQRCAWCGTDPLYVAYHDHEWGVPDHDPRALWEKLVLDGFQAGLSWIMQATGMVNDHLTGCHRHPDRLGAGR